MKRIRPGFPLAIGIAVALSANLLLLALYLWTPAGQTTLVELRNDGGSFTAFTDGVKVVPGGNDERDAAVLNAPPAGTIILVVPPALDVLPRPSGIDAIEVTGPDGEVLLRDDFDVLDLDRWEILAGDLRVRDGVLEALSTNSDNSIILQRPGWSEYDVAVTYRNGRSGVIGVNVTGDGSLFYHFDLLRDFPNYFSVTNGGERQPGAAGSLMRTDLQGPVRSTGWMLSRAYPYVLGALVVGVAAVLVLNPLTYRAARLRRPDWLHVPPRAPLVAAGLIAVAAGALSLYVNIEYYDFVPHLPDEVAYLYQARLFANLQVTDDIPSVPEAFYFYSPPFLYEHEGRWASFYPFGHPLALAVGQVFGMAKAVPSLVGGACVLLTFLIGRRLFDAGTALLAALLLAASPFFLMQSSSFMSHNTAMLYFLAALYFILRRDNPLLTGALAGLFFGLALNTRLLTAAALTPVFGALILAFLLIPGTSRAEGAASSPPLRRHGMDFRPWLRHTGMFVAASLLMVGALLAYNAAITGDPLTSAYTGTQGSQGELFGFREGHAVDIGLRNVQAQLAALLVVFSAWPAWLALSLVLLPFVLGTRDPRDGFLAAAVLVPIAVYVGYRYSGIYEGPRYWYETMPFLVLLSARGVVIAADRLARAAAWLRARSDLDFPALLPVARVVVLLPVLGLTLYGTAGWLTRDTDGARMALVPATAEDIRGIFGVDDRLDDLAGDMELENALVLVRPCGFFESRVCYGSVFLRNNLDFNGPVVWARYDEALNPQTIAAYPNRTVYVATWDPEPA